MLLKCRIIDSKQHSYTTKKHGCLKCSLCCQMHAVICCHVCACLSVLDSSEVTCVCWSPLQSDSPAGALVSLTLVFSPWPPPLHVSTVTKPVWTLRDLILSARQERACGCLSQVLMEALYCTPPSIHPSDVPWLCIIVILLYSSLKQSTDCAESTGYNCMNNHKQLALLGFLACKPH